MYNFNLTESYIPEQTDDMVREITVGGLLREVAAERPFTTALVEVTLAGEIGRSWTYAELLADSEKLALALSTRYAPGERITVWAPNIPEWVLAEYACALAGITLVTANPAFQPKELRYVLEQSGSVGLFMVPEYRSNPMAKIALEATKGLDKIREVVNSDGWLHSADLGTMDARGYVRVTGRVKEMIIRGGENLFPAEIENVLLEHPAIAEVAIVGLPDKKWGEIVGCFYRTEGNQPVDTSLLHRHCRQHLAAIKTPEIWCQVENFPLTGSGKIQRFVLRDDYLTGSLVSI